MDKKEREKQVKAEYGERAQVVPKYKPNRKQKRAQESMARQHKGKK
jgi:hypothetical protein